MPAHLAPEKLAANKNLQQYIALKLELGLTAFPQSLKKGAYQRFLLVNAMPFLCTQKTTLKCMNTESVKLFSL